MAIVTVGELLDRARTFEDRLATRYAEIRDQTEDPGVRLLTYYLARHRRHQELALAEYDRTQTNHIRDVKMKYDIPFDPQILFCRLDAPVATLSGDRLLQAAIAYDQALIDLYRAMLEQPLNDEVRAFFESLIRIEERDIVMMKKMIAMHYF